MIRILLVLLLIIFLLRAFGRVVIIRSVNRMQNRPPVPPQRPEGEITIESAKGKKAGSDGEYTDYEEIN